MIDRQVHDFGSLRQAAVFATSLRSLRNEAIQSLTDPSHA